MSTMGQGYEVPDDGEENPGDKVGSKEVEASPRPGEVNGGDEEILEDTENKNRNIILIIFMKLQSKRLSSRLR